MIVYCCADLIFASKIASTAGAMHLSSRPARDLQMLENRLQQKEDGKENLPVTSVIVDLSLGETALQMIRLTKAFKATLPVVSFGGHLLVDSLQAAKSAGADFIFTNGQFAAILPDMLQRLTKADYHSLHS